MEILLKPLTYLNRDVFRTLLGSSEFGGCFCAVWTSYSDDWEARCSDTAQPNFQITVDNLKQNKHVGYLVYMNSNLIGWTGSGPKTTFPLLETKLGSRLSEFSDKVWSLGCIAISKEFRGKGLSGMVIAAVIKEAKNYGAQAIEAYPVWPFHEPRSYRGNYKTFKQLGFEEAGREKDGDFDVLLLKLLLK